MAQMVVTLRGFQGIETSASHCKQVKLYCYSVASVLILSKKQCYRNQNIKLCT